MSTPALTTLSRALLRQRPYGTLATHSQHLPDFPFASVVPYVTDANGCPWFCMSQLAEHTQNVLANPKASFLVYAGQPHVQSQARVSLLGQVLAATPDAATHARFLRYLPDTAQYLSLGDFAFYRFVAEKLRYIGGFGHMGWHDASHLLLEQPLTSAAETACITAATQQYPNWTWLGADREGIDYQTPSQTRGRLVFPISSTIPAELIAALPALLAQVDVEHMAC